MAARPIPETHHAVTPYLNVKGAAKLIDFLKQAFGAEEVERFKMPNGTIMHAEVKIGDSRIMISEAGDQAPATESAIYLYVNDVDGTYKRALAAGGKQLMEVSDKFYGDRSGSLQDPCGNRWWVATHKEDVSKTELERRFQDMLKQQRAA
jgi:PhnB protein